MAKKKKIEPVADTIELAIPMPDGDGIGSEKFWCNEVERSGERLKKELPLMRKNLDAYMDGVRRNRQRTPKNQRDWVNVNVDFYTTENKKPALFYNTPDVQVTAEQTGLDQAAPIFQAVLNEKLGPKEIDAKRVVGEVLFDCLCPSGFGAVKVGYSSVKGIAKMPTGDYLPNPETGALEPQMMDVPKVIWDEYYIRHIDADNLRIPATFTSGRYEEAPWLGHRFHPDLLQLKAMGIDVSRVGDVPEDETLLSGADKEFASDMPSAVEIWYKASIYDSAEKNPLKIRRLVILERNKSKSGSILAHEDSPYQQFDEAGALTPDSMIGFPISVFALREVTGTAYPPSDCSVLRQLADEKNRGRTQMIEQRDHNKPMRGVNKQSASIPKSTVEAMERGETQSIILFDGPIQAQDFAVLSPASFPNENFVFDDKNQQDIDRITAMSSNQQGLQSQTGTTATQSNFIQQASDNRLSYERERVLSWFVQLVGKLASLLQKFADHDATVRIVGEDGAARLETWNKKKIAGKFAFSVKPDSSIRINASEEREVFLRYFNLTANHPNSNSIEQLRTLATVFNRDPAKMVNPQGPPPKEEKPKLSISIKGEDLAPTSPQFANVKILLAENGIQLPDVPSPENPVTSPTPIPPVNQHDADLTGRMSGPRLQ